MKIEESEEPALPVCAKCGILAKRVPPDGRCLYCGADVYSGAGGFERARDQDEGHPRDRRRSRLKYRVLGILEMAAGAGIVLLGNHEYFFPPEGAEEVHVSLLGGLIGGVIFAHGFLTVVLGKFVAWTLSDWEEEGDVSPWRRD